MGGVVIIGLIIGALLHKPAKKADKQQATTQSQDQQKTDQNKSSTSNDTKSTDAKSNSSTSTSTPAAPASATPAEDATAIGAVLQSTYSTGAPASANTCNKALSGYSYSIDDQQVATAKVTVVTQSSAGGNTIGVTMNKSGANWVITSASCN